MAIWPIEGGGVPLPFDHCWLQKHLRLIAGGEACSQSPVGQQKLPTEIFPDEGEIQSKPDMQFVTDAQILSM